VPLLRSQASTLSNLLEGGGTLLARAVEALDRVNRVLSDKNITTFGATLSDINVVSTELKDQTQVFADARSSLQAINKTAADYSELAKHLQELVDTDGKATFKNANEAVAEIKGAAADARQLVAALKAPTTDFATNGLPQLQSAIISLQGTAESLERLANELEASPRSLISKEPAKEIKVKP
jgi:phospholipid/cholesterol/gamma-HCH transport system substrate-binding protein